MALRDQRSRCLRSERVQLSEHEQRLSEVGQSLHAWDSPPRQVRELRSRCRGPRVQLTAGRMPMRPTSASLRASQPTTIGREWFFGFPHRGAAVNRRDFRRLSARSVALRRRSTTLDELPSSYPPLETLRARHKAAAQAVARAQLRELANLSDEEALRRTLSLEAFTDGPLPSRSESGLVQMQALFLRARRP